MIDQLRTPYTTLDRTSEQGISMVLHGSFLPTLAKLCGTTLPPNRLIWKAPKLEHVAERQAPLVLTADWYATLCRRQLVGAGDVRAVFDRLARGLPEGWIVPVADVTPTIEARLQAEWDYSGIPPWSSSGRDHGSTSA